MDWRVVALAFLVVSKQNIVLLFLLSRFATHVRLALECDVARDASFL